MSTHRNFSNITEIIEKAKTHTDEMEKRFQNEISYSVSNSVILDSSISKSDELINFGIEFVTKHKPKNTPKISVVDETTVDAIFDTKFGNLEYDVLNFASYKHPGGGFLTGSNAQEESLCHSSFLYNVLVNFGEYYKQNSENSNKHLYTNRAIYSPDVIFEKDNITTKVNVLTCAAPNWNAANKYKTATFNENSIALNSRIQFIFWCLGYMYNKNKESENKNKGLILGAFGCGVFGQDPIEVASIFKSYIDIGFTDNYKRIIFAIPGGNNYLKFVQEFK